MSEFADMSDPAGDDLRDRVERLLAEHDPAQCSETEFLRAQFDAGLAWVHFPEGLGGAGVARSRQNEVDAMLAAAGAPGPAKTRNAIGLGMAAPVIVAFGTPEQQQKYLRPLFTGEEIWCQLFSEPGAGSDLAAVATRAVREGDSWTVDGQKVWTSGAHQARRAILVARTDTSVPKHRGLTYFLLDMHQSGVDVRPLRQITGEAEFNEVYLDGVTVPDSDRLGEVGEGWKVATATLNSERVAIGAGLEREAGQIGIAARRWREHPEVRTPGAHDELMSWWVQSEALRLAGTRLGQLLAVGAPGP
ncbi:MAG: acyl-CoA dehydrogenase family protein, partial [Mobilicoccus sp.]|nr:acyl-CoA dehydrogenase family protein [Mobilicoccus sp.]